MKKSQIKEFRSKADHELQKMLLDQKRDLARIFIDLKAKKLKNTALMSSKKKIIATISTLLSERKLNKL